MNETHSDYSLNLEDESHARPERSGKPPSVFVRPHKQNRFKMEGEIEPKDIEIYWGLWRKRKFLPKEQEWASDWNGNTSYRICPKISRGFVQNEGYPIPDEAVELEFGTICKMDGSKTEFKIFIQANKNDTFPDPYLTIVVAPDKGCEPCEST